MRIPLVNGLPVFTLTDVYVAYRNTLVDSHVLSDNELSRIINWVRSGRDKEEAMIQAKASKVLNSPLVMH